MTQPNRYNEDGTLNNANAQRIVNLRYKGKPINSSQEFAVVINNYRAYGGGYFPNIDPGKIILAASDESRQVILKYIEMRGQIDPKPDEKWSFVPMRTRGPVVFYSSPLGAEALPPGVSFVEIADTGYGKYRLEN